MELLIKSFDLKILIHIAEILSGKVTPSYIPTNSLWHCSFPFNLTKLLIVNFNDFFFLIWFSKKISLFLLFISNKIEHIFRCLLVICFYPFENYQFVFCYSSFSYWYISDLSILKILTVCHINEELKKFCSLLSVLFMLLYAIRKFYTNTEAVKTGNSFLYVFLILLSFLERALLHLNLNIFFIISSSNFIAFFKKHLIFDPSLINFIRLSIIVSFPND